MSATYSVVRRSQHGEEPKVLETGFESIAEALAWIDERSAAITTPSTRETDMDDTEFQELAARVAELRKVYRAVPEDDAGEKAMAMARLTAASVKLDRAAAERVALEQAA